jgi:signal transduction histidine kinase
VSGLGHFVSDERGGHQVHDVCEAIASALTLFHHQLGERIRLRTSYPDGPAYVAGDEARLGQAFLNLLENAIQAIHGEGEIQVAVATSKTRIEVTIADTGCGMEAEQLARAFDLGFTKREGRVRLRMGLSITKRAIEEAGGTLVLESEPGRGTSALVALPAATPPE